MVRRFFKFYKPHLNLFILDMSAAVGASIFAIFFPYLTRLLLKEYIPSKDLRMIIILILIILGIYIIKTIMAYVRIKWGHILGTRIEYDMRNDIFRHIQKLSFNYFDNVKTGHLMSRISNDLTTITEVAHHAPEDLLISICVIGGAFFFMFDFNAKMALISLIPIPLMFLWGTIIGRKMEEGFRTVRKKIADINSTVENSVQGIREVKSYANEDIEIIKFEKTNTKFKNSRENIFTIMALFFSVMHFFRDIYYLTVIASGAWFIYKGEIDVADLVAFLLYVSIILPPIDRLINFLEQFYQGTTSFERFIEVMDIEPDIKDKKNAYSYETVKGEIIIDNITFGYDTSPGNVVQNIDMKISAGQRIAIVGESGAGKSTIVSLIPRFYEAQEGEILIDGHNIMGLKQQFLREKIGLVQQNVFLFDTTIKENILYGKPDASEDELFEAVKNANLETFIDSLPDGLDTLVGERGVKLSGGQKQRVSIARVFLKNPPILIFDEATSALDSESENLIQEAMFELSQNRTTIIIAHRLSTVKNVDKIYAMKKGKIVESGTHKSLIRKKGYYYSLYTRNLL